MFYYFFLCDFAWCILLICDINLLYLYILCSFCFFWNFLAFFYFSFFAIYLVGLEKVQPVVWSFSFLGCPFSRVEVLPFVHLFLLFTFAPSGGACLARGQRQGNLFHHLVVLEPVLYLCGGALDHLGVYTSVYYARSVLIGSAKLLSFGNWLKWTWSSGVPTPFIHPRNCASLLLFFCICVNLCWLSWCWSPTVLECLFSIQD